jgi:hypothetical protein
MPEEIFPELPIVGRTITFKLFNLNFKEVSKFVVNKGSE